MIKQAKSEVVEMNLWDDVIDEWPYKKIKPLGWRDLMGCRWQLRCRPCQQHKRRKVEANFFDFLDPLKVNFISKTIKLNRFVKGEHLFSIVKRSSFLEHSQEMTLWNWDHVSGSGWLLSCDMAVFKAFDPNLKNKFHKECIHLWSTWHT